MLNYNIGGEEVSVLMLARGRLMDYSRTNPSLREDDIPYHVEALIDFLGRQEIDRALKQYIKGRSFNK